jgi:hypothetical protein
MNSKHDNCDAIRILTPGRRALVKFVLTSADSFKKTNWKPWRFKYESSEYFYLLMSRTESGIWFTWLYFAGYAQQAQEYWCKIEVFSKNNPKKSIMFSGDVSPMTIDPDTVQELGNGLTFADPIVQKFKYDDRLYFYVSIGQR